MVMLGGIQLSIPEILLTFALVFLTVTTLVCMRRIAKLQQQVTAFQSDVSREVKMVNQGAIGLGRRFSSLEARLKKSAGASVARAEKVAVKNPASAFELIRSDTLKQSHTQTATSEDEALSMTTRTRAKKHRTQAEQSLSRWMNEQQSA